MKRLYRIYQLGDEEGEYHIGLIRLSWEQFTSLQERLSKSVYPYNSYEFEEVNGEGWLEINHLLKEVENEEEKEKKRLEEWKRNPPKPSPLSSFYDKQMLNRLKNGASLIYTGKGIKGEASASIDKKGNIKFRKNKK